MNKLKKTLTGASVLLLIIVGFIACDDEFNTIGDEIIENNNFSTALFDETILSATNRRIAPVQTNGLPVYQLGRNQDPVYGTVMSSVTLQASLPSTDLNPEFGDKSQAEEDADTTDTEEMETVTKVYLNIPFFSTRSLDDDGIIVSAVDSVYGDKTAPFTLTVKEFTYFLRSIDEDGNPQAYYSDQDFSGFTGETLFSGQVTIDENEIEIPQLDDEGNIVLDDNGNAVIEETLSPRIRVELNTDFFQQRIINNEGSVKLSNNNVFRAEDLLRGLHLSVNDDINLLMLLNLQNANIIIEYEYQQLDTQGNTDPTDDEAVTAESTYALSLSTANIINSFTASTSFPDVTATNDNLYLKGGEGAMATIELFGPDTDNNGIADQLEEIRENGWIINDANLVFHVNQTLQGDATDPQRIYLYNIDDAVPLEDYLVDQTVNVESPSLSKAIHGGILERDDSGDGVRYKIRITEHINNLIRKDSTNVKLGLVSSSDIRIVSSGREQTGSSDIDFIPTVSIMNPFGTVLHGSTANSPADKRLRLEIFYSVPGSN